MPELSLDGLRTGGGGNIAGAILFMQAGTNVFDVYSALNSSPWTSENFGADPQKAASCREYVLHSMVWTSFYCGLAAWISKSWWPIFGLALANVYMWWLYERALKRGAAAGSQGWANG
jgi:hypothetical protein